MTQGKALEGSLAERDVPELVQAFTADGATGILTLTNAGVGKRVILQEGRMVFASSTSPDDRLGELLLRRGRLTLKQYVEAGRAVGPGKRLGTILVEQGALSPKDLVKAVVEHTQEIIYGAFQWTEGRWRLQEGADTSEAITLKISGPDIIMEGIRRIEAWSRVERGAGGIDARYARADDYENTLRNMTLSFEKLSLLTSLNEAHSVAEICAESSLPDYEVCRTLWAFRVIGVVRRLDSPGTARPDAEDEGLGFVLTQE